MDEDSGSRKKTFQTCLKHRDRLKVLDEIGAGDMWQVRREAEIFMLQKNLSQLMEGVTSLLSSDSSTLLIPAMKGHRTNCAGGVWARKEKAPATSPLGGQEILLFLWGDLTTPHLLCITQLVFRHSFVILGTNVQDSYDCMLSLPLPLACSQLMKDFWMPR